MRASAKTPTRFDLALVVADEPCACAAVFTQNVFCAAPVTVSREHLDGRVGYGTAQRRGRKLRQRQRGHGRARARRPRAKRPRIASRCPSAARRTEVLVASTGVIGEHLPLEPFATGIPPRRPSQLSVASGGADAARAIMTTDTRPKEAAVTFSGDGIGYDGCTFTVGGMAKGSGMIMPNMATMIAVLTTDAPVRPDALHAALSRAAGRSFNKVTVDSDTSTNDSCFLFSNGGATSSTVPFRSGLSGARPLRAGARSRVPERSRARWPPTARAPRASSP